VAVKREYRCNLCGEADRDGILGDPANLIGLHWSGAVIVERPWRETERHICPKCLSSLQSFTPVCGDGFQGCKGGPRCQSDHK
jgi:hypothetical protein